VKTEPRGRKARPITDVTSTALVKEMAVRLHKLVQCWTKYIKKRGDYVKKQRTPESYTVVLILINTLRTLSDPSSRIIHDHTYVKAQNW
jgi:hypothetical protein